MIVFHQFPPAFGLINASAFCLKLEAWLRLAGLAYRVEPLHDLATAPKGKAPFIEENGQAMGDSALIIQHLTRTRGVDLDAWLTPEKRAIGRAAGLMLEDHLYFVILYDRWVDPAHWPSVRDTMLAGVPDEVRAMMREEVHDSIRKQGLGRHRGEEIHALGVADITALADVLSTKPFLLGDRPATVDCIAFAFVHTLLCPEFDGPLRQAVLRRDNLVAHERRFRERVFPETVKVAA